MSTLRPARGTATAAPAREARPRPAEAGTRRAYWWQGREGRRYCALVYALGMLGLVFVFSSSFPHAGRPNSGADPSYFFRHHLVYFLLGLAAMLAVSSLRPLTLARGASWLMAGSVGLLLLLFVYGVRIGGSLNWMEVFGVRFQPSELVKAAYVLFMAMMVARGSRGGDNAKRIGLMVALTALLVIILLKQKDLGMAVLIMGIALGMALLGGMKLHWWSLLFLAVSAVGFAAAWTEPYRRARLLAWIDLAHHRSGVGYHVYGMLISLARGGVPGSGLGMSPDKWRTLPVPHTDSIFCVIGGELGLWGGVGVIALMALLGLWAFGIARNAPNRLGWFLAAGSGLALFLQAFINIAVATATVPVTGLTLPFISYGGTSLISCMILAGLVLSVAGEREQAEG